MWYRIVTVDESLRIHARGNQVFKDLISAGTWCRGYLASNDPGLFPVVLPDHVSVNAGDSLVDAMVKLGLNQSDVVRRLRQILATAKRERPVAAHDLLLTSIASKEELPLFRAVKSAVLTEVHCVYCADELVAYCPQPRIADLVSRALNAIVESAQDGLMDELRGTDARFSQGQSKA